MKTFFELREKTLTPAELKKREEIAKAIKRENPNMPMGKKMAIATATAKKVAEEVALDEISKKTLGNYIKTAGPDRERRTKNATNLSNVGHDIRGHDPEHAKKLFSKAGHELHKAANRKAGINKAVNKLVGEEVEQIDEISQSAKDQYIKKSVSSFNHSNAVRKDAQSRGDTTLAKIMRKRMDNRNKGMTRAFGGERA